MKLINRRNRIPLGIIAGLIVISAILYLITKPEVLVEGRQERRAPVEVAPITRGAIELRRTFNGSLESEHSFIVAPKVSGEIVAIHMDIGDPVKHGAVIAKLNDDEFQQDLAQAEAELKVAEANRVQSRNALEIAEREFNRIQTLQTRGVSSEAEFDQARAEKLSRSAQLEVAQAQVAREEAAVEAAQIRLGYTRVMADWTVDTQSSGRYVGERFVDEGQTVSANEPLLSIVQIQPIAGVFYVTERDYSRIRIGQEVRLRTDAFPDKLFFGEVSRIAPVFQERSRQARVEVRIENSEEELKPGMFMRADVTLNSREDAVIIPFAALTKRDKQDGIFLLSEDEKTVRWQPVTVGIKEGNRVSVEGLDLPGRVVTLGHQMIDDGSAVTLPESGKANGSVSPSGK